MESRRWGLNKYYCGLCIFGGHIFPYLSSISVSLSLLSIMSLCLSLSLSSPWGEYPLWYSFYLHGTLTNHGPRSMGPGGHRLKHLKQWGQLPPPPHTHTFKLSFSGSLFARMINLTSTLHLVRQIQPKTRCFVYTTHLILTTALRDGGCCYSPVTMGEADT